MNDSTYSYQFYSTTQAAWDAMFEALRAAKKSIFWEVFIFVDDRIGEQFIEILSAKAKAGLEVKMVIDAIGGRDFSKSAARRLKEAGVDLQFYNRLQPDFRVARWISRLWFRNHRKVLIVDEDVVFIGGVNVKANYQAWDDIYLKIAGLVPRPLLRGFAKSYISSGGKKDAVRYMLKLDDRRGWHDLKEKMKFIVHSPQFERQKVSRKFYLRALALGKESVNFLTPYYAPDKEFLKAITLAKKRGVKVNIFMPLRPDIKIMELIARAYFRLTIKAGANVYLLPKMNHGKAVTVDDKSGLVGSINVTPRSFSINEESGVYFNDEKMVDELNGIFNGYKKTAQLVNQEMLGRQTWWSRIKDWVASWFDRYV